MKFNQKLSAVEKITPIKINKHRTDDFGNFFKNQVKKICNEPGNNLA